MDIGEEERTIVIEPVKIPVPAKEPTPAPPPPREPAKAPEKIPA